MSSIFNKNYINLTYDSSNIKNEYPKQLIKHLFDDHKNKKILDVGNGNGILTKNLIEIGLDAYGIDTSEESIKIIGDRFKKVNIQNEKYPFEDNTFDIVFSKSVIEHLREPDFLIKESYRILKPGGFIYTMTPSWKHNYKEQFYIDHTHVSPFTKHSIKMVHEFEYFETIKSEYFYQLPFTWKYKKSSLLCDFISIFNIPYRPFEDVFWPDEFNKFIRFSKEVMLLYVGKKK
jgi:ubiquinone/menaquinone biosynthesis C-methylase UbiE